MTKNEVGPILSFKFKTMKTIILVEDEKFLSETISDELSEAGYNVHIAGTGKKCIELIKAKMPDLVILDINLPDMSGLKVLEKIRELSANLPVMMCSAMDSLKTDPKLWGMYINDYFVKPVDLDDLKIKVKKLIKE